MKNWIKELNAAKNRFLGNANHEIYKSLQLDDSLIKKEEIFSFFLRLVYEKFKQLF